MKHAFWFVFILAVAMFVGCGDDSVPVGGEPDSEATMPRTEAVSPEQPAEKETPEAPVKKAVPEASEQEATGETSLMATAPLTAEEADTEIRLVLTRGPWTKETPYGNRWFTLIIRNTAGSPVRLDDRLLDPLKMAQIVSERGGPVPLFKPKGDDEEPMKEPDVVEIPPGREETRRFTMGDLTNAAGLDAMVYTVQCWYHGELAGEPSDDMDICTRKIASNKIVVESPPRRVSYDLNGRLTKAVSEDGQATMQLYDDAGRVTRVVK